jgi:hypothetical protein
MGLQVPQSLEEISEVVGVEARHSNVSVYGWHEMDVQRAVVVEGWDLSAKQCQQQVTAGEIYYFLKFFQVAFVFQLLFFLYLWCTIFRNLASSTALL